MVVLTEANLRTTLWTNLDTVLGAIVYTDSPTIVQSFNDRDPSFPQIVFPSASLDVDKPTLDGSVRWWRGQYVLQFMATDPLVLDRMVNETQVGIDANSSLESDGIQFTEDYWRESEAEPFFLNKNKVHSKFVTIRFCIKNIA